MFMTHVKRLYTEADWSKQSDYGLVWKQPANLQLQTVAAIHFSAILLGIGRRNMLLCSISSKRKISFNSLFCIFRDKFAIKQPLNCKFLFIPESDR